MPKINKIIPQTVALSHDDLGFIGWVNELELLDFRVQVKNEEVDGYYITYNNDRVYIAKTGQMTHWPEGFFDLTEKLLIKLLT